MEIRILEPRWDNAVARTIPTARAAWADETASPRVVRLPLRRSLPPPALQTFRRLEDREFLQMNEAYGLHGGFASGDEVAWRMRRDHEQPISTLAKWIVRREIVSLVWRSQLLVPLFQFNNDDMQVREIVRDVLAELADVFDDWELATWFAQPNAFLRNDRPVDFVSIDDAGLLHAARADRFVARG